MLTRNRRPPVHSRPRAAPSPAGLRLLSPNARCYRRIRQIVAAAPVINVHVGAGLPPPLATRPTAAVHWAILEGARTVGLVQQQRGFCWALDPARRDDARVPPLLAELLERQMRSTETILGPTPEVAAVTWEAEHRGA